MSSREERLAEWQELLDDQPKSGMSVKEWCASEGISTQTYYYWRKQLRDSSPAIAPAPSWLPLPVALEEPSSVSRVLTLRVGQVSLDVAAGFDAVLLSSVLAVLEARC
ncbi:MAG: IS66 family insertion sequence element accessory protein TnpA [Capsulimonadaceae bacterium]